MVGIQDAEKNISFIHLKSINLFGTSLAAQLIVFRWRLKSSTWDYKVISGSYPTINEFKDQIHENKYRPD